MRFEPPELWWSPSLGAITETSRGAVMVIARNGEVVSVRELMFDDLPDDAVPLGVIDDPKHRGPSYERGYRDGFLACRAGVPNPTEENNRG